MSNTITILGDVCLAGRHIQEHVAAGASDWNPLSAFSSDTYLVANLECPISDRGSPLPFKYAALRASPQLAVGLNGLDLAVIANNHISDFGEQAVADTLDILQAHGVATVGYGRNILDSWQPHSTEVDGLSVQVFAASCPTTNGENLATHVSPGVAPLSMEYLERKLKEHAAHNAVKIVYLHWGLENMHRVVPEQVAVARAAIDWGADAVIGCHGHVIQPYERYNGRWIFYGLGNFLFDDVTIQIRDGSGGVTESILSQCPENRESLAVRFMVGSSDGTPSLTLQEVVPVSSKDRLAPCSVRLNELIADPQVINRKIPDALPPRFISPRAGAELLYATRFSNGTLIYNYFSETAHVDPPDRAPHVLRWARRLWNRLRRIR
ncbi:MAG: CapA family protein [Planctomycetaceae bacterium]